jgi:hypothetical protein
MKNISFILIQVLFFASSFAQNQSTDTQRLAITTIVHNDANELSAEVVSNLESRLSSVLVKNGFEGGRSNSRFVLLVKPLILNKDIVASAPPMVSLNLEFLLIIGNGIDGEKFNTISLKAKGAGINETKAYLNAINSIKPDSPDIQKFLADGKNSIVAYYNNKCDFTLKEAESLVNTQQYEQAIALLLNVPDVSKNCYEKSLNLLPAVYKKYIDNKCQLDLANAKNVWNTNQNYEGAEKIAKILEKSDPSGKCYQEILKFTSEVSKKIAEVDKREWNFVSTYEKDKLKAYRDIGVAYGNNQPKTMNYNINNWLR